MKGRVTEAQDRLAAIELHNKMNAKDLADVNKDLDNLQTGTSLR